MPDRTDKEGKGPGQRLRTGSVPLAAGSVSVVYWVPGPFPRPTLSSRIGAAGPASEPGAGLSSNLPLIAAMSTTNPWHPCYSRFDVSYIKSQLGQLFAARWSPMAQEVQPVWTSLGCASAAICRFCPMRDAHCRPAAKICGRCPLAGRGFGVWITPLGVT